MGAMLWLPCAPHLAGVFDDRWFVHAYEITRGGHWALRLPACAVAGKRPPPGEAQASCPSSSLPRLLLGSGGLGAQGTSLQTAMARSPRPIFPHAQVQFAARPSVGGGVAELLLRQVPRGPVRGLGAFRDSEAEKEACE